MSWSVQAIGKAPAVAAEIAKQFASQSKCSEPEETVRQAAMALVTASIEAQDAATVVLKVEASGSQSTDFKTMAYRNQLKITIEPLYGFIE